MSIADAPFIDVAVPQGFSPISKAYWQTNASVEEIALRFSLKSGKAVTKRAGKATLRGILCKHCGKDFVAANRGQAITEINTFRKSGKFNRVECRPCFDKERDRRFRERFAKLKAEESSNVNPVKKQASKKIVSPSAKEEFYKSWEWRTLRMEAIQKHGRSCQCCGASPGQKDASGAPVRICVDHIKPISKHWHLRLDLSNLQILCDECNQGKGNWSETDFRPAPVADEWVIDEPGVPDDILSQLTDRTTGRLQ